MSAARRTANGLARLGSALSIIKQPVTSSRVKQNTPVCVSSVLADEPPYVIVAAELVKEAQVFCFSVTKHDNCMNFLFVSTGTFAVNR